MSLKQKALKRERVEKELKEQLLSLKDQLRKSEDVRLKAESLGKKIMIEKSVLEEKIKQLTKDTGQCSTALILSSRSLKTARRKERS